MQSQAKQFIELLDSKQLLAPEMVEELRRQVAESKTRLTPELLAKLLVDNGHLTRFQASKLVSELKPEDTGDTSTTSEESELGFADDEEPSPAAEPVAEVYFDDEEEDVVEELGDEDVVEVVDPEPVEVQVGEVAEAFENLSDSSGDFDAQEIPRATPKPVRPPTAKTNPWDSFRILGVGLMLALVLIAGIWLVYYFWRGSAEERLAEADEAYQQRSYETAATMYEEFSNSFPGNEQASYARVRAGLANMRHDGENAPDPTIGLATAQQWLPKIADEAALPEQRSDLAGILVNLADKFNARADDAETTADRKQLMEDMQSVLELINNPMYVGSNERNQQAPTLLRIQEDRERILRDINRDDDLQAALAEIDERLQEKNTAAAYRIRSTLIDDYPILESNPELNARVQEATEIQRSLVTDASTSFQLAEAAPATAVGRSYLLTHRMGTSAADLRGRIEFVRAKGAIYGLNGEDGQVLWQHYVGREFDSQPIRLSDTAKSDVLVSNPQLGHLSRLSGESGQSKWFVDFATPINPATAQQEDIYITTQEGIVSNLDAISGQAKWQVQLPQSIPVPPGSAFDKPQLYVPADRSNLYVISRQDGRCQEVYYTGHRPGAISIPPVLLLGQLFVFDNAGSDYALIRILQTDENGLKLTQAQAPIRVKGNIVVPPQIDGRRLYVSTDLGEIMVLDIEPTADSEKVTEFTRIPANLFQPRLSWAVASSNRLWVADSRFTRFDLQVSLGKLARAWIRNDSDEFTGPPRLIEDTILHQRMLRGNRGIRVSAVDADTGDPYWSTDLGVPISLLVRPDGDRPSAINTSGMVFQLKGQEIQATADSNPGQGKSSLNFDDSIELSTGARVLLNRAKPNQIAHFKPEQRRMQLLLASFGSARPSCPPVAVGENMAIGLDNGQLVMVDPTNGAMAAAPYQPSLEPGSQVQWNRPSYLANAQTLIVSSNLQKLVRLSVGETLRPLTEVDLEFPLIGELVSGSGRVYAIQSTPTGDACAVFDATSLKTIEVSPLNGRVLRGPFATDTGCLVQTGEQLISFDASGTQLWSVPFPASPIVGTPVDQGDSWLFALQAGALHSLSKQTGEEMGVIEAGRPFSSAPLVLPSGVLVGSDDGAVLALPVPKPGSGG